MTLLTLTKGFRQTFTNPVPSAAAGFFAPWMGKEVCLSAYRRYEELQQYVNWTAMDAERVGSVRELLSPYFPALIDDFYAVIKEHPQALKVITGGEVQIARLKRTLLDWLAELFSGNYDRTYVERRWRVGLRHVEIGLNQVYTNAALSRLRRGLLDALYQSWTGELERLLEIRASLNTLIDLDLALIEDAYQTEYHRRTSTAERLATIGKVAGGVAHELRNPLNVVKTSVYYLRNAKAPPPEKVASHLERIERQVGVADRVITALNDFARLPLPQVDYLEVESCLREILEVTSLPRAIQIEWQIGSPSPGVLGDRAQLQIVFANLIRNARDAMPEGGTLRLECHREGATTAITIQDSGVGIAPENLTRITEPLFSTKAKGMGLGLAIARDILERHHGDLSVTSQLGVGSCFTVQLPSAERPSCAEGTSDERPATESPDR
jgi:signal transduction histidine kinase